MLSLEFFVEKPALCGEHSSLAIRCTVDVSLAEEYYWGILRYTQEPNIPINSERKKKLHTNCGEGKVS
jgi:hypothetical protein